VWNRTPGRDDALVAAGAERAPTPAAAARDAEIVVTMLADPPALEAVVFGPDGVAGSIGPEAVLIDMSTVGAGAIRRVADGLRPVAVLDAPVLGSVPHAASGTLTILVGGDPQAFARTEGLLGTLGTPIHVGPSGAGATLKLANNAASMSALIGLGEVLAMTDRAGIDQSVALDAIGRGPLGSVVERWGGKITGAVQRVDFRLALARKDLALAVEEGAGLGARLTVPAAAVARADEAIAAGMADRDNSSVVAHIRA
jgi:3-hydroxyisobutyrate dehydrogenase-like beta-hydroxyacid dehydrogenase